MCQWYQGDGFPRCMLGTRFGESSTPKYGIMRMKLGHCHCFSLSMTTSQAMSISSMGISVTDTNPDTGVGTVFSCEGNGKLYRYHPKNGHGRDDVVCQPDLSRNSDGPGFSWQNALSISFSGSLNADYQQDGLPLSTNCVHFSGISNLEKARMWRPTCMGI